MSLVPLAALPPRGAGRTTPHCHRMAVQLNTLAKQLAKIAQDAGAGLTARVNESDARYAHPPERIRACIRTQPPSTTIDELPPPPPPDDLRAASSARMPAAQRDGRPE